MIPRVGATRGTAGLLLLALGCRAPPPPPLEVEFLGVGGYLLRVGRTSVMTPPMYSNPPFVDATLGTIAARPDLVDRFVSGVALGDVPAVLVGHAHYDHILDLPLLWPRTDEATVYGNASMAHILAAHAPDRAERCPELGAPEPPIPRERVVALDAEGLVDWRGCPALGEGRGDWVRAGDTLRFRALCSLHPPQWGDVHFAPGSIDEDLCAVPSRGDGWLEGTTLAFLIDFLDADGDPIRRVYYQDAPTTPPIGLPVSELLEELLEELPIDLALLNVGNTDAVDDHPGGTLRQLAPRFAIGGHWEDFFRTQDQPLVPLIGHDIEAYEERVAAAMPPRDDDGSRALVDGVVSSARHWVPAPGTRFVLP